MKLTTEQQNAVNIINKNIIVNAGAGTGKTEVLTRRYLEILKSGNLEAGKEISSIVAITFTKKAAKEMKERIRVLLKEDDDKDINRLLSDLNDAQISTVHSFCIRIIRENSIYLDIDPEFSVLEEKDSIRILEESIFKVFNNDEEYSKFALELMKDADLDDMDKIFQGIKNIYLSIRNTIFKIEKIENITLSKIEELNKFDKIDEIYNELKYIEENVKLAKNTNLFKFLQDEEKVENLKEEKNLLELIKNTSTLKKDELDYLKSLFDEQLQFNEYSKKDRYTTVFNILQEVEKEYNNKKSLMGKFDFNDLEHLTLQLLENKSIKENIQKDISYLMVDEYQDSNDIQKEIFYKICSREDTLDRDNLFVVGDPKQSIYGFRGANINVFENTKRDILNNNGELIIFHDNYRTNENILKGINNIYSKLMSNRYNSLSPNRKSQNKMIYFNNDNKVDGEYEASNISNFIAKDVMESNKGFGDYTLLFRSRSGQELFEKNFEDRNIKYYTFDSLGFFKSDEIRLTIEILKLYKNEENHISLYYILKSKIFNIRDEELLFYLKENENKKIENSINTIMHMIENLKQYKYINISDFLSRLYLLFGLFEIYNFSNEGIQSQGNLYKLKEIASDFDEKNLSLDEFIYSMIFNENDQTMKQVENENSDVVKLMTIHGSKGLGFNDVVVPNINKPTRRFSDLFKFNKEEGISINIKAGNYRNNLISNMEKELSIIENDNLYYVAMTRSKNNLLLGLSGRKSGYKKTLIEEVENLEAEDLIRRLECDEFTPYMEENQEILEKESIFKNLEDIEFDENNIINTSITKILNHINNEESKQRVIELSNNETNYFKLPLDLVGDIVHRYAQLYEEPYNLTIEDVLKEFGLSKNYEKELVKYINNFIKMYNKNYDFVYREVEFNYKYKNCFFRGIIDRIEIVGKNVKIIDYKFSSLEEADIKEKYWIQLVFYGLICEKIFTGKNIELEIENIRKNYISKIEFSGESKNKLLNILDNYIDAI